MGNASYLIMSVHRDGRFVYMNQEARAALEYQGHDVTTKKNHDIIPAILPLPWDEIREAILQGRQYTLETVLMTSKGRENPFKIVLNHLGFKGKQFCCCFAKDISDRKQAEEVIRHALAEKEVLLREVHQRVKNNRAAIISLIGLQTALLTGSAAVSHLKDPETRIRSMALVHESLYLTKDLARVNVPGYTEYLTRHLFHTYGTGDDIRCRTGIGDITMPLETAIPCGTVMSEIVTNSLRYAFPDTFSCEKNRGEPCTITITLQREGSDYHLTIADNGIMGYQNGSMSPCPPRSGCS